jgi:N-acetylglucosamine kinase-like BadF-type ATPase
MKFVLGVDGGGSKTHALVLSSQGKVLGFGAAGCGNHQVHGSAHAAREIESAVKTALRQAALTPQEIEIGVFCLAGADLPADYSLLAEAVHSLHLARTVEVKNDTLAALRASITRPWGAVVICGSGFNAAARASDGREIVLPGLGIISGDWGGGSQLSLEIIRLVMRAWDGRGEKTQLTSLVLDHFCLPSEEVLVEHLYHEKIAPLKILALVPLLFRAAEAGDPPARELIIRLGEEVAVTATALLKRLNLDTLDVEVGLAGGVFQGEGPLLIETVTRRVLEAAPAARVLRTRHEPVVGAALLALERIGVVVDEGVSGELCRTLPPQLTNNKCSTSPSG